jgi:hypothetical protein
MSDWKFGHEGANSKEPSAEWLRSVGEDTVSKAAVAINKALATLEDLVVRLDRLAERDAEAAAAAARSSREVGK